MKRLILDGSLGMEAIHDLLAAELAFPDYYGRNLDALYDCLTEIREDVELELVNLDHLARKGQMLQRLIQDAAAGNPHIYL